MTDSTVWVTGATGYNAQHVFDQLLQRKHEDHQVRREIFLLLNNFEEKCPSAKLTFKIVADIAAETSPVVLQSHSMKVVWSLLSMVLKMQSKCMLQNNYCCNHLVLRSTAGTEEETWGTNNHKWIVESNELGRCKKSWFQAYLVSKKYVEQAA